LLTDEANEKKFGFDLSARSIDVKFLAGWNVFVTASVQPAPSSMQGIIQGAGGKVRCTTRLRLYSLLCRCTALTLCSCLFSVQMLTKAPTSFSDSMLIVSADEDEKVHTKLHKLGYTIHTNEIILSGVLRQKLQPDEPAHILLAAAKDEPAASKSRARRK
jgi:hypothetical protein